tara:strand:- start:7108 stop:8391 length:1284 start_codon:yes stop_codon:yes gene_type:complete
MRLVDLRNMIANIVDYDPAVDTYRQQITDLINDAYYRLYTEKQFTFAQKETIVKAYKDIEVNVTTANPTTAQLDFAPGVTPIPTHWAGQVIEIDGTEYEIAWVETTTRMWLTTDTPNLTAATTYTAKIKFRYLDLPSDCVSILNVAKRSMTLTPQEPGMFTALARYEDEYYNLPLDEVNLPNYWVPYDEYHVSTPRAVKSLTPAGGATGTSVTLNVSMSYVYAGRESALSAFTTITTDLPNLTVGFTVLPNRTGYYRKVYVSNPSLGWKGERCLTVSGSTTNLIPVTSSGATFNIAHTIFEDNFEFETKPYTAIDGNTQRIRLYPRQDQDYNITIRYMFRPQPLVNDNDTPEMPSSSHHILAYMALRELFVKLDNLPQANMYERKVAQEMVKLEQRYLTQIPRRFVKRGMLDGVVNPLPLYTPLTRT